MPQGPEDPVSGFAKVQESERAGNIEIKTATVFDNDRRATREAMRRLESARLTLTQAQWALGAGFGDKPDLAWLLDEVAEAVQISDVLARYFEVLYLRRSDAAPDDIWRKERCLEMAIRPLSAKLVRAHPGPQPRAERELERQAKVAEEVLLELNSLPLRIPRSLDAEYRERVSQNRRNPPPPPSPLQLAQRQYEIAAGFPGEFVVIRGTDVLCHTPDEAEASRCYYEALKDVPDNPAAFIPPAASAPERMPAFRPRTYRGR